MTTSKNTPPPGDTRVSATRSGEFLILHIDRGRRIRHLYLRPDEAAMVVSVLQGELPKVTTRKASPRELGTNPRAQGTNPRSRA